MRILALVLFPAVSLVVWYVRARHGEKKHRLETERLRAERAVKLEQAACAVDHQARISRDVARRIEDAPVEIPSTLRVALNAVVTELDGVAADLRSCQVPVVVERRTLVHHR